MKNNDKLRMLIASIASLTAVFSVASYGMSREGREDLQKRIEFVRAGQLNPAVRELGPIIQRRIAELARMRYGEITFSNKSLHNMRIRISQIQGPGQYKLIHDFYLQSPWAEWNIGHSQTFRLPIGPLRVSVLGQERYGEQYGAYYGSAEISEDQLEGLSEIRFKTDGLRLDYADGREIELGIEKNPRVHAAQ